jgi:hypothetical protein
MIEVLFEVIEFEIEHSGEFGLASAAQQSACTRYTLPSWQHRLW